MRTFSQEHWSGALEAWTDGEFSDEWKPYRHQAAMRGMIYPPEGTKWDSWEDDEPSQRAMLIRGIRETPTLMHEAISRSRTWGDVVAYIIHRRDEWRDELADKDRETARRHLDEPDARQATSSLKAIIERIADS